MYPPSACRSPRFPGAWIDGNAGRSSRVSSRPYSGFSLGADAAGSFPRREILPQKYERSEKLNLELWDPHRLAAHIMATLSPEDERATAVNLVLEKNITGAFLAHYTYDIEAILPDENSQIFQAIARTIPCTFWIQWRAPRPKGRYNLREIVKDIRASKTNLANFSATRPVPASSFWEWAEEGEAEAEVAPSDSVDAYPASTSDASGRSRPRSHRVWAWVSKFVCLPRSTFEDWGATFTFLSEVARGWRANDDAQARRARPAHVAVPSSSRGGAGTDDPGDMNLSCLWR